jgi:hypothetical protein
MEDEDCLRKYYAKCLAKLQIEFIKDRNPKASKSCIPVYVFNEKKNEKTKNK